MVKTMTGQALIGRRIKLTAPMTNPNSKWMPVEEGMPAGLEGTIVLVNFDGPIEWHQIHVKWDNGRSLALMPYVDAYELLPKPEGAVNVS
jgi:hypothetical protein